MQTRFAAERLTDPRTARSERAIRACVHCGFCQSTCPTYVLLGDERDSPRGRIYLIQDMLENERTPSPDVVRHVDRCLSCLACVSTCPSDVDYMHLIDHARAYIENYASRPWPERLLRAALVAVLPRPALFRWALAGASLVRPLRDLAPARVKAALALAPARPIAPIAARPPVRSPARGVRRLRMALLGGCVQQVLAPHINAAATRLLARHGVEIIIPRGADCCGALAHHMGKEAPAKAAARRLIDAWIAEIDGEGLTAIVSTTSGCGVTIKDYPALFDDEPQMRAKAERVAALAKDVTEVLESLDLQFVPAGEEGRPSVAYHAACSLQHGQKITAAPARLLAAAGFPVKPIAEAHLCCGSAGVYNILQPEIAAELGARKARHVLAAGGEVIATGNIGCMTQIAQASGRPVVHTVELLDWACGGPRPAGA